MQYENNIFSNNESEQMLSNAFEYVYTIMCNTTYQGNHDLIQKLDNKSCD